MKNIAIIGAGWRAETYYKIASLVDDFKVSVGVVRNSEKAKEIENKYGVKTVKDINGLSSFSVDFAVSCVSKANIYSVAQQLSLLNIPVLTETPAGFTEKDGENLIELAKNFKIQVAEQYFMQPRFIALNNIIKSGEIGEVNNLYISCAHDYHAVSLIRKLLNTGDKIPTVKCITIPDTYAEIYGRYGKTPLSVKEHYRKLALLDFGNKTAIYDFSGQYFAEIRKPKICIQGVFGEIDFNSVTKIKNEEVFTNDIVYRYFGTGGNLYSTGIDTITYLDKVLYTNDKPMLSCEELAILSALYGMVNYLKTGEEFYSVKDAVIDSLIARRFVD